MVQKSLTATEKLSYSLKELADATGVSVPFLRLEIARGNLQPTRLGRRVVVPKAEAERYLAAGAAR
jgi:excisionase family DNA binding protein